MSNEMTKDPGMVERIVNFYLAFDLTCYLAVFLTFFLFAVASSCSGQMITEVEGSIWYRFGADLVILGSRFWVCADVKFGPLLTYFFLSWGISRCILSVTAIR